MYLKFNLHARQLIQFMKSYEGERNIEVNKFVYLTDFIVIKYDQAITTIEVAYDEIMQVNTIIPGQFELTQNEVDLLTNHRHREEMFKEAKLYCDDLMKEENLGYYREIHVYCREG